jgi:hypothetical protein
MATNDNGRSQADIDRDVAKYRRAAEETLEQLDWCVSYLYRIRKPALAQTLEKSRTAIRRRMREPHD